MAVVANSVKQKMMLQIFLRDVLPRFGVEIENIL